MIDPIAIHPFDPHTASPAAWAQYHALRRIREAEDEPDEPLLGDAEFEHDLCRGWPSRAFRRFTAHVGGEMVGSLGFSFRREGTQDYEAYARYVYAWGGVVRAHRRRGVGTALLRPLLAFMQEHDKTTATLTTHLDEGRAFLTAIGAVEKHRVFENRMSFAGLDWAQLAAWRDSAIPAGSGLRWEIHAGRTPKDRLAALMPTFTDLHRDVPTGALDTPPTRYEMRMYDTWYAEMDRRGGEHYLVLLTDGDAVAAMCEASWDARFPDRVYQTLTIVARGWRGKGLGKGVKGAMLLLLRERHPEVRMMTTANAEANAPMLSINERLGFSVYRQDSTFQIARESLAAWLAGRDGAG